MYNLMRLIDGIWVQVASYPDRVTATKELIIAQLAHPNVCMVQV